MYQPLEIQGSGVYITCPSYHPTRYQSLFLSHLEACYQRATAHVILNLKLTLCQSSEFSSLVLQLFREQALSSLVKPLSRLLPTQRLEQPTIM